MNDFHSVLVLLQLQFTCHNSPHAYSWFILVVAVELWCSQHGLCEHGQEADGLNVDGEVQQEVGEHPHRHGEGGHEFHIAQEVRPLPEVVKIKIW